MTDLGTMEKELSDTKTFERNLTESQLGEYLRYLERNIPDSIIYRITGFDDIPKTLEINLEKGEGMTIPMVFQRNVYFGREKETDKEVLGYSGYEIHYSGVLSDKKIELAETVSKATDEFFRKEYNNIKNKL
jgi:hypothetical protein